MELKRKVHPYFAVIAIVLTGAVFYVSLLPKQEIPEVKLFQIDKLVHFSMYLILTLTYALAFFQWRTPAFVNKIAPALMAFSVGLIVELLQHFATNTRFFDVFDILANATGILFGYYLLKKLSLTS